MKLIAARSDFKLPQRLTLGKQVTYCLSVIDRYRKELPYLRAQNTNLKSRKDNLENKVEYWKEKYEKEKKISDELTKENEKLKQEIEKLTKTNSRYHVALFDHGNFTSSEPSGKKRGGQLGHANTNREVKENRSLWPRERIFAKVCGKCHKKLSRVSAFKTKALLDIVVCPQAVKLVVESERQWCTNCRVEVCAKDKRSLPFTEYGINTFMVVLILRFGAHSSLRNITKVVTIGFGLNLAKSDVANMLSAASRYLGSRYQKLINAVRAGKVMYNDETGWQVRGQSAWMWIMANSDTTVYFAAESRGKGIMEEMYGTSSAYSMHDGLPSYTQPVPKNKQVYCWAHLLRFAFEETVTSENGSLAIRVRDELLAIYHLKCSPCANPPKLLERQASRRIDKLLKVKSKEPAVLAIQNRLKTQKDGLVRALVVTPDATNNLAERELRPMAIRKHIWYGSDTYGGMETTAVVGSIWQTLTRQKTNLLPSLKLYLHKGVKEKYSQYVHQPFIDSS